MDENIFLQHQLYSLIVSQLRDDSYFQAAAVVANATFTPVETGLPPNKLLELVRKGIAAEREAAARAGGRPGAPLSHADKDSAPLPGGGGGAPSGYGLPPPASATPDFRSVSHACACSVLLPLEVCQVLPSQPAKVSQLSMLGLSEPARRRSWPRVQGLGSRWRWDQRRRRRHESPD
eukprot:jgi/Mesen1/1507/ME000132S00445